MVNLEGERKAMEAIDEMWIALQWVLDNGRVPDVAVAAWETMLNGRTSETAERASWLSTEEYHVSKAALSAQHAISCTSCINHGNVYTNLTKSHVDCAIVHCQLLGYMS